MADEQATTGINLGKKAKTDPVTPAPVEESKASAPETTQAPETKPDAKDEPKLPDAPAKAKGPFIAKRELKEDDDAAIVRQGAMNEVLKQAQDAGIVSPVLEFRQLSAITFEIEAKGPSKFNLPEGSASE